MRRGHASRVATAPGASIRVGRREIQGQVAVFNLLNSNVVLTENEQFGVTLGEPRNILQGRMLRLGLLFNF